MDRNVSVAVRVRPFLSSEKETAQYLDIHEKHIAIGQEKFEFTRVFRPDDRNADVFEWIRPCIAQVISGRNATFMAYGQTRSGKTFSCEGTEQSPGVVPRMLEGLFASIDKLQQEFQFRVQVSCLEVYEERVYDLLSKDSDPCDLKVGQQGVDGLSVRAVSSARECRRVVAEATRRRATGFSYLNENSSRSHAVVQVRVCSEGQGAVRTSVLSMVDLAGSELLVAGNGGQQQQETKSINLSLFNLKGVISALQQGASHIPYRNSVLTRLLQESLGGNCMTAVLCCLSPRPQDQGFSLRTLRFGRVARHVVNKVRVNQVRPGRNREVQGITVVDLAERKADRSSEHSGTRGKGGSEAKDERLPEREVVRVTLCWPVGKSTSEWGLPSERTGGHYDCVLSVYGKVGSPCVLFVNSYGRGSCEDNFRYMVEPLCRLGWQAVFLDMPGCGRATLQFKEATGHVIPPADGSGGTDGSGGCGRTRNGYWSILNDVSQSSLSSCSKHLFSSKRAHYAQLGGAVDCVSAVAGLCRSERQASRLAVFGYDYGAGVCITMAGQRKTCPFDLLISFHPPNLDEQTFARVARRTLALAVRRDQFHSFKHISRMLRLVSNSTLVTLDCGEFNADTPKHHYRLIGDLVAEKVTVWLSKMARSRKRSPSRRKERKSNPSKKRGDMSSGKKRSGSTTESPTASSDSVKAKSIRDSADKPHRTRSRSPAGRKSRGARARSCNRTATDTATDGGPPTGIGDLYCTLQARFRSDRVVHSILGYMGCGDSRDWLALADRVPVGPAPVLERKTAQSRTSPVDQLAVPKFSGQTSMRPISSLPKKDLAFIRSSPCAESKNLQAFFIDIKLGQRVYSINCRYLPSTKGKKQHSVMCSHGFGAMTNWCRWWVVGNALASQLDCNVLWFDWPGFGDSSGASLQTKVWKEDGPSLIQGLVHAMGWQGTVSMVAVCGGAATFMRTLVTDYGARFANANHILHNCVTSRWEPDLEQRIQAYRSHVLVTWIEDKDHSRYCVSYKALKKVGPRNPALTFVVSDESKDMMGLATIQGKGLGRCGVHAALMFQPSQQYLDTVVPFLTSQQPKKLLRSFKTQFDISSKS